MGAGKAGRIVISAEEQEATTNSEIVKFNPVAQLNDSELCFFIIYRMITLGKYTPIYKSEIKRPETGSFRWNQVQIGTTDLCKDNIENEVKIEFFRSVTSGRHKNIGQLTLTLAQLKEGQKEYALDRKRGTMNLTNLVVERQHSFLEYVFGGCEIDLSIAIDFTLSNGCP